MTSSDRLDPGGYAKGTSIPKDTIWALSVAFPTVPGSAGQEGYARSGHPATDAPEYFRSVIVVCPTRCHRLFVEGSGLSGKFFQKSTGKSGNDNVSNCAK